jgi:hypothetical protein
MIKSIIITALMLLFVFITNAQIFDDFEAGNLDNWKIGGRQLGVDYSEIIFRNSSNQAHIHHEGFSEITIEKTVCYNPELVFQFDMETYYQSEGPDTGNYYALAGVCFHLIDTADNLNGFVAYVSSSSSYYYDNNNALPERNVNVVSPGIQNHFDLSYSDLINQITALGEIDSIKIQFITYASGVSYNMYADLWLDNVAIYMDCNNMPLYDDFESSGLSNWTVGGRQQGINNNEVTYRNNSNMAHLYHEDFSEITLEKTFCYEEDLIFHYEMETEVFSDAGSTSSYFSMAGVHFLFYDMCNEFVGNVSYINSSSTTYFDNNTYEHKSINEISSGLFSYTLSIQELTDQIIPTGTINSVKIQFISYASGSSYNMGGDIWIDNVEIDNVINQSFKILNTGTIEVFPNPVSDNLYIKSDSERFHTFQICDLTGKALLQGKTFNKTINLNSLKSGVYLIKLLNESSNIQVIKFVKR